MRANVGDTYTLGLMSGEHERKKARVNGSGIRGSREFNARGSKARVNGSAYRE